VDPENSMTACAADRLAAFAGQFAFEDLPAHVIDPAKLCLIDAVACAIFGAAFPAAISRADPIRSGVVPRRQWRSMKLRRNSGDLTGVDRHCEALLQALLDIENVADLGGLEF
jgi:hypothetical protein